MKNDISVTRGGRVGSRVSQLWQEYNGRNAMCVNAQQVAKIRRIVEDLGCEVATPDEAREILDLKGGDRVNF